MKKWMILFTCLTAVLSAHSTDDDDEYDCSACQCTIDSDCSCMSQPECINQNGTCTPDAHCGCYTPLGCDCTECTACELNPNCCRPKSNVVPPLED